MPTTYRDLIQQTTNWPTLDFDLNTQGLTFHGIPLMDVVRDHGTPLRLTYLPKIGQKVDEARSLFQNAMAMNAYPATYTPCYCTKSSHFAFVLEEALKHEAHLETSSAYDIDIIWQLAAEGKLSADTYILCNGFKPKNYTDRIADLISAGYENTVPILDNPEELALYQHQIDQPFQLGLRLATEEEPQFEFYTSRLGMGRNDLMELYRSQIKEAPQLQLKLLHFFVNSGIRDDGYYWNELAKAVHCYCDLKAECPELDSLDIGGGLPVPQSLNFSYNYEQIARQIITNIQQICNERGVAPPHLFTEFGQYTVAESGAIILGIIGEKRQNDAETWYMIDNSIITSLPDAWSTGERFVMLPVNRWDEPYQRVNLGGLTCDSMDYYNSEIHERQVFLPTHESADPLIVGFFYTGAYQEALSGYGGLKHCLIPGMQHILVDVDGDGNPYYQQFRGAQSSKEMLALLGFNTA